MDYENIFRKLHKFWRELINIGIVNILIRSGFDSKSALLSESADDMIKFDYSTV